MPYSVEIQDTEEWAAACKRKKKAVWLCEHFYPSITGGDHDVRELFTKRPALNTYFHLFVVSLDKQWASIFPFTFFFKQFLLWQFDAGSEIIAHINSYYWFD